MKLVALGSIVALGVRLAAAAETNAPPVTADARPPAAVAVAPAQTTVVQTATAPAAAGSSVTTTEITSLLSSGRQFLQQGKWAEAMALFEKVRSADASNQEAAFGLSAAFIETDRLPEALPLLERLYRELPDNSMVRNNLAWVYAKAKDPAVRNPEKAVKLAREAVLDVPADASVWNTLAEAYFACGKFDRAVRAAESALRLNMLAGVTNVAPSRELVLRCKRAAGVPIQETENE